MKARIIYILTFIFVVKLCFGQTKFKSASKVPLDLNAIEFILIRNNPINSDPAKTIYRQLDYKQCQLFVKTFNNSKSCGLYKFIVEYWVDIHFRNGSIRSFRINSKHLKERGDTTFDLGDTKCLENLWKNAMTIETAK